MLPKPLGPGQTLQVCACVHCVYELVCVVFKRGSVFAPAHVYVALDLCVMRRLRCGGDIVCFQNLSDLAKHYRSVHACVRVCVRACTRVCACSRVYQDLVCCERLAGVRSGPCNACFQPSQTLRSIREVC